MSVKKYKIGLTFGVFDLFHVGHLNLIRRAKEKCDFLVVSVTTDEYVMEKKGHYPTIPFEDRLRIVAAIKYVDKVCPQDGYEFSKQNCIKMYKPDVLFVGDDWNKNTYSGEGLGVKVIYLPYTKYVSSTIIKQLLTNSK